MRTEASIFRLTSVIMVITSRNVIICEGRGMIMIMMGRLTMSSMQSLYDEQRRLFAWSDEKVTA